MIEINFFEKKKKNYSPLILVAIFLIGILIIGAYVILMNTSLQNQSEQNQAQITEQQPLVTELKQTQTFANQVNDLSDHLELLEESQYPTPYLYETIDQLLPESDVLNLLDYTFSINDGIRLSVQLDGLDQVIDVQRSILALPFVTQVELGTVDLINQTDLHYLINLQAEIDRDLLSEVTQDD